MERLALFFAACIAFASIASAQERPVPAITLNSIYVGADGKFETAPDTALIQFVVASQEKSAEKAYETAAQAAARVREILRSNAVDPVRAEVGQYSLQPMYDWKTAKREIVGFRVTANVSLKLKDFNKVGPLMQAFASIEETDNQSISYALENIEAAKQKAVKDAFQKAKTSAQTVAKAGGRSLGQLSYSSVDTFEQPIPVYADMSRVKTTAESNQNPAPTAEFSPQKITVTAHVNALFELK